MVGNADDQESMMMKMADEYRRKKLGQITLGMLAYSHEMKDGHLVQSGTDEILFPVQVCDLKPGEISWQEQNFARIDGGEPITITLLIDCNGNKRRVELPMTAPDTEGFWQIGLEMQPGFAVRIAVGNPKLYCYSDITPLLQDA